MKKIAFRPEDDVLDAARRYAAERNTSVHALVREYLTNLAARARLMQLSQQSQGRLGKKTWAREELHDR
jgi:hypothetical protein